MGIFKLLNTETDLLKTFLSNGSVDMLHRAAIETVSVEEC
jgi:hypothetical protein